MFQLRLFFYKHDDKGNVVDAIVIRCRNYNKETELHLKDTPIEEIITKFLLNAIFNHVGILSIICSNNAMIYEIE